METNQKTALITGSNKGIGFEISHQLGKLGFKVIVSGRDEKRISKAVESLIADDIIAQPLLMDVGDVASIQAAFETLKDTVKSLDVLINNAGILIDENKPLLQFTSDEVHQTFSINALGPFFVSQIFLPLISKEGRIINISSGAGSICGGISHYAPLYAASSMYFSIQLMLFIVSSFLSSASQFRQPER